MARMRSCFFYAILLFFLCVYHPREKHEKKEGNKNKEIIEEIAKRKSKKKIEKIE